MSRRRSTDVHHYSGRVRFKCPDGHPLGRAFKQQGRYGLEIGLVRIDGPNGETKIKARCETCEAAGRHRDLQASWEKVLPLLDEIEADPARGESEYVLGG